MLYDAVSDLVVDIESIAFKGHERETSSGFTRATTVVSLEGAGVTGVGEDVTYDTAEHVTFQRRGAPTPLTGTYTIDEFSGQLSTHDLFPDSDPDQSIFRNYRQWAFESAALDLALKQARRTLATQLDRQYDPVRFVVSTRLEDPPTGETVLDWLEIDPGLAFKLDPTPDWTQDVIDRLAETEAVRILDLKGLYSDSSVEQPADPALYTEIIEQFPEAIIEDPELTEATRPLFEGHEERVSWDYPIRSVDTIDALPWGPTWLNIKPSRFGSIQRLFETLEYCLEHGIRLYGGGQFELDVGRRHLHALASLFYPDGPNDVAPRGYNTPERTSGLPSSPLDPGSPSSGLEWGRG